MTRFKVAELIFASLYSIPKFANRLTARFCLTMLEQPPQAHAVSAVTENMIGCGMSIDFANDAVSKSHVCDSKQRFSKRNTFSLRERLLLFLIIVAIFFL